MSLACVGELATGGVSMTVFCGPLSGRSTRWSPSIRLSVRPSVCLSRVITVASLQRKWPADSNYFVPL